jgi:hypothetical protein
MKRSSFAMEESIQPRRFPLPQSYFQDRPKKAKRKKKGDFTMREILKSRY